MNSTLAFYQIWPCRDPENSIPLIFGNTSPQTRGSIRIFADLQNILFLQFPKHSMCVSDILEEQLGAWRACLLYNPASWKRMWNLAWLIVKSSSDGPIAPWRSLFLVEGFPSVIVAVFAWFMIPDAPGSAAFLETRQRMVAQLRMGESANPKYPTYRRRFNWGEVRKTLADPKAYITAVCSLSLDVLILANGSA